MSVPLLAELKRRNVIRVAGLYLVGAWLITQVAGTVLPMFDAPAWLPRTIVVLLAIGFTPVMIFSWVYELTPQGFRRDADVPPEQSIGHVTGRRIDRAIIAVLIVALTYFAVDKFVLAPRRDAAFVAAAAQGGAATRASAPAPDAHSIAVLPFVDMSQAHDQEYFSDGLSEELLNLLAQLPQLRVIARTSSFSFKGREADVATIAAALGVAHVLEGSVRKSGNTLRITAQLIRAADSSHVWSKTYDRELTDVFKVQDEIAGEVVAALKVQLLPDQMLTNPHRSANIEAYTQYLLGNAASDRATFDGWQHAVAAYRKAVELDPRYAAAYAALGRIEGFVADRLGDAAGMQQSLQDAGTAIALAPELADGYVAREYARLAFQRDWAGARADAEKALALSPGDASVELGQVGVMRALGRVTEGIAAARKAIDLDPLSAAAWLQLGRFLNAGTDRAGARRALDRALEIAPESEQAHYHRGINHLLVGNAVAALADFGKAGAVYGSAGTAMAEHALGHAGESQRALDETIARHAQGAAYQIAEVYAWRGENDKAFEWLERALAQRDGGLSFIRIDPLIDALSADGRYAAFLGKMGLPK